MAQKSRRSPQKAVKQFVDGPKIPAQLLGELRAAKADLDRASADCEEHNRIGKLKQQQYDRATHVFNHYADRVIAKLKVGPQDVVDLDRGIISIFTPEGT